MNRALKSRLVAACGILATLLSVLSARLLYIEVVQGEALSADARMHYEYKETLPATRGRIFDRRGELLARNQTVYTLVVDFHHLRDQGLACIALGRKEGVSPMAIRRRYLPEEILNRYREHVVDCMAEPLRMPRHELARRLRERRTGEIVLARDIEDDYARQLEGILEENDLGGLHLRLGERRYYPSPLSLTQVIGYVNEEGEGMSGIERIFNEEMKGRPGYRYCERDRRRREIHAYRGLQVDPVPGRDVHLTVDMALQAVVERELDAVIDKYRPEKVSAIWMDPVTGEILAMANRPHFDLSTRMGIRGQEPVRRNIAVSDNFQPGSTFKIVGYGGAFDRGLITPTAEVDCHWGSYELDGFVLRDHHAYGRMTVQMAFAKSSNIGAYVVARPLNRHGFHHYMHQFGFGSRTGIELTAESPGRVHPVSRWTRTSFSSQVMGYEVAVTPLQLAMSAAVVANEGVHRAPTIVKGVREGGRDSMLVKGSERPARRVLSERAVRQLLSCMKEATGDEGTGKLAVVPGYSVAGKTGTARKHVENVGYVRGRYVASFVGFLPADDPQLLGLILIDDPRAEDRQVFGGSVAAPVFQAIAQDAVRLLGIEPDRPEELEAGEEAPSLVLVEPEAGQEGGRE